MISKQELIEIINSLKIKFNPDILDKLTKRVEKMTNSEYLEILTKENIKTSSDAEKRIENMVLTMEKTRLQRQEGEYEERITQDDILNDIFQRARKLNNRNVKEIGYFVYHELCLHFKENTESFFEERRKRVAHYDDLLSDDYSGICKNMAEVYADIMRMLGHEVKLVVRDPIISEFPHVDAILFDNFNEERYFMNLIGDIYRIRSKRISKFFGELPDAGYRMRIEEIYGELTSICEDEIRKMDKNFGFMGDDEKYTNEIVDELINYEVDEDLTLFELVQKFISSSNTDLKTMDNTGYIETTQHFRNPIVKMAFKGLISREDYFNKVFGCDCVRDENLAHMQWLLMVWEEIKNEFRYFTFESGQNTLTEISRDEILQELQNGNLRILKPVKSDRTLPIDEYEQILLKYFSVDDKQIESLLQMYKKQVVINILKTLYDNGTILSDGDMEKRLSQIKTMPFEEFKQTETQIYNLLKQLSKRQFGDTQEIETRISRMSSAMDNKNLEISDTYQELEI